MKTYKLEIWVFGNLSEFYESSDIDVIKRRYLMYLGHDCGIKLFINGDRVKYLDVNKVLNISKSEIINYSNK